MYLIKFLASSGLCSRRKAGDFIKSGFVKVNLKKEVNPAYLVEPGDKVFLFGKEVFLETKKYYFILNKPVGFICSKKDPEGRRTVFDLMPKDISKKLFSVGRLDFYTSGLIILTNDGDFSYKLTHPKFEIKKEYEVILTNPFLEKDFNFLKKGLSLEDGFIKPDKLSMISQDKILLTIHSGKNRIIRRIFDHLGYKIKSLKRIGFGDLSLSNLSTSKFRTLSSKEVESFGL